MSHFCDAAFAVSCLRIPGTAPAWRGRPTCTARNVVDDGRALSQHRPAGTRGLGLSISSPLLQRHRIWRPYLKCSVSPVMDVFP